MLLVPTDTHVELALAGGADEPVRTLRGFVRDAVGAWAPDLALASVHAVRMAARAALDEGAAFAGELPVEPAGRAALAHAIDRTIGRLRRAGVRPRDLRRLGHPRADRLAAMLASVDGILEEARLLDPRAAGFALAARIARGDGELPGAITVRGVVAWEADDLAWLEAAHTRARRAGDPGVRLELPRLGGEGIGGDDDDPIAPIADALERRWASLGDAPELTWIAGATPAALAIIEARGREGEARATANAVLDALSRGAAPERIAILVPELDEAALEPLRAALEDARIPAWEPRGRSPLACPEARVALALLELAEGPVTRELLIEILRAPGLHAGWWTERTGEIDAANRAALLAHRLRDVPVAVDRSGRLFAQALAAGGGDPWMARVLERMLSSIGWLRDATTGRELARRFLKLLELLALGSPSVGELAAALRTEERGGSALALHAIGSGATAVRAIREATEAIAEGAEAVGRGDAPCTPRELGVEIERALDWARTAHGGAVRAGAVRIARAAELAGLPHDLVIVTGLDARAYGGTDPDGDSLLDDAAAADLPAPSRPASGRERSAWTRAELGWALSGAARVLYATSPPREDDEPASPHPLVRAARDRGTAVRREPASRVSPLASRVDTRSAELCRLAAGAAPSADVAARAAIERERTAFFLDPERRPGPHTGRIPMSQHLIGCVGGATSEASIPVTHVERAAGCAFSGFARRVLRVRRAEDAGEAADPRERGNLVHRALHAAFVAMSAAGVVDPPRALAAARHAAEAELARGPMTPLRREATAQAVAEAMRVVVRALEGDDGLRFAMAERRFGAGEAPPWTALRIAGDGDDEACVFVDGQIDRVDRSADGRAARVVDYKTGKPPDAADHGRIAFQLPLYAEMVARALESERVETIYLRVRAGGAIEERPRKPDERISTSSDRREALATARRVVLGLWRGEVAPRPVRATLCARCDVRDVCRRPAIMPIVEEAEERP